MDSLRTRLLHTVTRFSHIRRCRFLRRLDSLHLFWTPKSSQASAFEWHSYRAAINRARKSQSTSTDAFKPLWASCKMWKMVGPKSEAWINLNEAGAWTLTNDSQSPSPITITKTCLKSEQIENDPVASMHCGWNQHSSATRHVCFISFFLLRIHNHCSTCIDSRWVR